MATQSITEHGPSQDNRLDSALQVSHQVEGAVELVATTAEGVASVTGALLGVVSAPVLEAAGAIAASVLVMLQGAPMGIGTAAKLLLLLRDAVENVRGFDELVNRAKRSFADYAQALKDIDQM